MLRVLLSMNDNGNIICVLERLTIKAHESNGDTVNGFLSSTFY
jgi:hypothetical protein